jgi:hypothetical protein
MVRHAFVKVYETVKLILDLAVHIQVLYFLLLQLLVDALKLLAFFADTFVLL